MKISQLSTSFMAALFERLTAKTIKSDLIDFQVRDYVKKHLQTALGVLSILLFVWIHPVNAQVPSGYLSTDQITGAALNGTDRSAVVLVHGWNPDSSVVNKFADGDWPQLVNALSTRLNNTGTKLLLFHWENDASTGSTEWWTLGQAGFYNAWAAAENGSSNGTPLAQMLNTAAPDLRKITFIAHSAGSWVAYRAIEQLLRLNPYVIVDLVLLDPFIPGVDPNIGTLLNTALMSNLAALPSADRIYRLENYYEIGLTDTSLAASSGSNATSQIFSWRIRDIFHRVDYTPNQLLHLGDYYGIEPAELNGHPADLSGHSGPIRFYADTVTAATSGAIVPDGLARAPWNFTSIGFYRGLTYEGFLLPTITAQPQAPAQPVQLGQPVTLSVSANPTNSFQWFKNGQPYPATSSTLTFNSVSAGDAGEYVVRLTNTYGQAFSEKAVLQVASVPPPTITSVYPASLTTSSSAQTINIYGSNFTNTSTLVFYYPDNSGSSPPRTPSYFSSGELRYAATFPTSGTWKVKVVDGAVESTPFTFYVSSASAVLTGLSINGPSTVNENGTGSFTATAIFSDGSAPTFTATWGVSGSVASINPTSGQLTAGSVSSDTLVTVSASYSTGGITKTASANVTIVNSGGGGGTQTQELITNGGFESGTVGWTMSGPGVFSTYPHTGSKYAVMGELNNVVDTMYQTIGIPANATSVTLSYWYNIVSAETGSTAYDLLNVTIQNTGGSFLTGVDLKSNVNKEPGPGNPYYRLKTFDLFSYIGQTIRVNFLASTDGSTFTSFKIDDVSVQAVVPVPVTLTSLAINGPSSVNEGNTAQYTATAIFSDGTTRAVTPSSWQLNSSFGWMESNGLLHTDQVTTDVVTSITASYTENGVTRQANKSMTIVNVAATFSYLAISGPTTVNENSSGQFTATAIFSDGSSQPASPSWSQNSGVASISGTGLLAANEVSSDTTVTVSASYTIGGVTRTASQNVTIANVPAPVTLVSLSINGPSSLNENSTVQYTATATFSDGTSPTVDPIWSEDSATAIISSFGMLSAGEVASDTIVNVSASYSVGGITRTASKSLIVVNNTSAPVYTLYVEPSGVCGGNVPCYPTIQNAIDAGGNGITIKVAQGTYYEHLAVTSFNNASKNFILEGGWNGNFTSRNNDPSLTVIDGAGNGRGMYVYSAFAENVIITVDSFTITNGTVPSELGGEGGGISAYTGTDGSFISLYINNSAIINNTASQRGGGIHAQSPAGSITLGLTKNVIKGNTSTRWAGGIGATSAGSGNVSLILSNNLIVENVAGYHGGGVWMWTENSSSMTFVSANNTITRNTATYEGGGIHSYSGFYGTNTSNSISMTNDILWGNSAGSLGGDIYVNQGAGGTSSVTAAYSDIGNSYGSYTYNVGGTNLNVDPLFVNSLNSDYHLKSCSPAVDAGDPLYNFSQEPIPNGGRINMGAYGNTSQAALSPDPTDTDFDGKVDACDNCTQAANADQRDTNKDGYGNLCDADLNNDGLTTAADYLILRSRLNKADADADLNGDGFVTAADYLILRSRLNQPPGPSGLAPGGAGR